MTLADDIATRLSGTITRLGQSWSVAVRSSDPTATPAFSAYADVKAVATGKQEVEDNDGNNYYRTQVINVRVGGSTEYSIGDRLKDPSGVIYAIVAIASNGYGSTMYSCKRVDEHYVSKGGVE